MILRKYSAAIVSRLATMTMSEIRTVTWLALNTPYNDGRIIINRRVKATISCQTKVPISTINNVIPRLVKSRLISRVDNSKHRSTIYKVHIRFPIGKHLVAVPAKPLFVIDEL